MSEQDVTHAAEGVALLDTRPLPGHARARRVVRSYLVASDVVALSGAFLVAEVATARHPRDLAFLVLSIGASLGLLGFAGLYDRDRWKTGHSTADELGTLLMSIAVSTFAAQTATWALHNSTPTRLTLLAFWATASVFVPCARGLGRTLAKRRDPRQNVVIVGAGETGQLYARKLLQHPEYRVDFKGFLDDSPGQCRGALQDSRLIGSPDDLLEIIERTRVDRIIIAFSDDHHERTLDLIRSLKTLPVRIDVVPRLFETLGHRVAIDFVEGLPLVSLRRNHNGRSALGVKRSVDIVCASIGLVLAAPFFAYAAWRIRHESPGPVFFRQSRLGKGMEEFTVLKFRSMRSDADPEVHRAYIERSMGGVVAPEANGLFKLERKTAVTPFGYWLRRTSLDELPQLLNVLRGEMSLVGPRPCLEYETRFFAPHHFARFLVKPGMTGLWQVTARARATFREALEMDAGYALNWSLGLDLALLIRTPLQLVRSRVTV